ncbi:MAG: hypothetical protein WC408_06295 [Candidatus Micrarchaeia archaeon]|jgi:small-conductance mechanosensitive channel
MDFLGAPNAFDILRTAIFVAFALIAPGYLFLKLKRKNSRLHHLFGTSEEDGLFEGFVEKIFLSAAISVVICCIVFIALTFTIGLNFWSALAGISAVVLLEGWLIWKEKR